MRKIIHVDMDAFFASVEQRDEPSLLGKPVIVGGKPDSRGVVAACSYEARKFGVRSAMPSSQAYRLCPQAIFVRPRFEAYQQASTEIHRIFKEYTSLVEPLSLDEAFLDVTDCHQQQGSATLIANDIRQKILQETRLTASAGVSYNKFLAKIASDMNKPNGLYLIEPEQAEAFIEQLEVRKFCGVVKVTEEKMHQQKIYPGKDLKSRSKAELIQLFGKSGSHYYNIARGIDERPVKAHRVRKSIGKETTFGDDKVDMEEIMDVLNRLTSSVIKVLETKNMQAKTLTLKVKYSDFQLVTRSQTVEEFIHSEQQIHSLLPNLIDKTDLGKQPVRLLGISLSSLRQADTLSTSDAESSNNNQLALFE